MSNESLLQEVQRLRAENIEYRAALNWIIGHCWSFRALSKSKAISDRGFNNIEERAKKALGETDVD